MMDKLLVIFGIIAIITVISCGLYTITVDICTEDVHHHYQIIDKRIEGGRYSAYVLVTENGEYTVIPKKKKKTDINDTLDIITTEDGQYKEYKIIKK